MLEFASDKSAASKAKHGIDFDEAQALWKDEERLELPSRDGISETRWLVIGMIGDKHWTAIVTYRDALTRLISCRHARRNEERL